MTTSTRPGNDLKTLGLRLSIARDAAASAQNDALDAAVAQINAGEVSEREAARLLGVHVHTIRKHMGKDPRARGD